MKVLTGAIVFAYFALWVALVFYGLHLIGRWWH